TVKLTKIMNEFNLETLYLPEEEVLIESADVNRPGLPISGFFEYYDPKRIQIIGKAEYTYLKNLSIEERNEKMTSLFEHKVPALIFTRDIPVHPEILTLAEKYKVPVLRTSLMTSEFMSALIAYLNNELAPRITRHGVLVEVYGEGILILGESGIGKSEAAVELMKRGHRLIADDAVEIKKVSAKALVGSSPEIIRHFIEIRCIGVIDVQKIFGMGAVKETEKIDLIIQLEPWDSQKQYERLGLDDNYYELLGLKKPTVTIPIKPGRNLAIIIEVAAMNNRQRRLGYNAAAELNKRLLDSMNNM
ncbi:MAG: HPr(Ser) kinase/phosphatase, partial [Clostridia bacterium]|nr:HPr(Ser) kinase/phosphatase [Clostridia bacterium]